MDGSFISREGTQRRSKFGGMGWRGQEKIKCWKAGIEVLDEWSNWGNSAGSWILGLGVPKRFDLKYTFVWASLVAQLVKNMPVHIFHMRLNQESM